MALPDPNAVPQLPGLGFQGIPDGTTANNAILNAPVLNAPILTGTLYGVPISMNPNTVAYAGPGVQGQLLTARGAGQPPAFTNAAASAAQVGGASVVNGPVPAPASTTPTMAGLAASGLGMFALFNPSRSNRVLLLLNGTIVVPAGDPAGSGLILQPRWLTGTAPTNGAAAVGNTISWATSGVQACIGLGGTTVPTLFPFSIICYLSVGQMGQNNWFDLTQAQLVAGGTAFMQGLQFVAFEQ